MIEGKGMYQSTRVIADIHRTRALMEWSGGQATPVIMDFYVLQISGETIQTFSQVKMVRNACVFVRNQLFREMTSSFSRTIQRKNGLDKIIGDLNKICLV